METRRHRASWTPTLARVRLACKRRAILGGLLLGYQKDGYFGEQVGEETDLARALEVDSLFNVPVLRMGERFEIVHCQEMDIRGIVPVVRE